MSARCLNRPLRLQHAYCFQFSLYGTVIPLFTVLDESVSKSRSMETLNATLAIKCVRATYFGGSLRNVHEWKVDLCQ